MNYLIVAVISFTLGFIVELGYLYVRGRRILVPFISATSRNFTIAAVVLSLVALMTVINVSNASEKTAECNRQFREAIKYNTELTSEQHDINARATEISADRRILLDQTFTALTAALDQPGRGDIQRVISNYNEKAATYAKEYDRLIAYRNSLDTKRKPYPEPTC